MTACVKVENLLKIVFKILCFDTDTITHTIFVNEKEIFIVERGKIGDDNNHWQHN